MVGVPDLTIYVKVSPSTSVQRKDDIIAPAYVEERAQLYEEVAAALGPDRIRTLDGDGDLEKVSRELEQLLEAAG